MKPTGGMKHVPRTSKPNPNHEAPSWLEEQVYAPKRQRTAELVKQAVDALLAEGSRVSLTSVATKSRQLDPEGTGVSESAILTNDEARAYYEQHRTWRGPRGRRSAAAGMPSDPAPVRVKPDRNVARVRQRYMRLSKQELTDRLLAVEQAYAEQESRWLRLNDELLALKLQVEQAESSQAVPGKGKVTSH